MLPQLKRTHYQVGDWVRMVSLPSYVATWRSNMVPVCQRHARVLEQCLGRRLQIIYIGDDGRPELGVSRDIAHAMGSLGISISIEPGCVVLA
jgi:hypothetical protein